MFCSRCGARVEESARYCQLCGQEVEPLSPSGPILPPAVIASASGPLPYAGFWVRFAAYLIDGVVLGVPFFFVVIGMMFRFRGLRLMAGGGPFDRPGLPF